LTPEVRLKKIEVKKT